MTPLGRICEESKQALTSGTEPGPLTRIDKSMTLFGVRFQVRPRQGRGLVYARMANG